MAITVTNAMCTSFKKELMTATHNFTITSGHVFKMALLKSAAAGTGTYGAATTNYSNITGNTDEASGTNYSAGGFAWTAAQNITPQTGGTTAFTSWSVNPSWASASFTSCGAVIYNSSASNAAVATFTFGGDQTVSSGTFTVVLPTNDQTNAILRIT